MDDADSRTSKLILACAGAGAALNLADSARTRGPLRAAAFFALATGLPALGEFLVTGPLALLRHRTRPRPGGVPVAVLLLWYCVIHGAYSATERALPLPDEKTRRAALPLAAALAATSLDLVLDPFGLDAGLWEWRADGAYAPDVRGPNGRHGVPPLNYWGWLFLVTGVSLAYGRLFPDGGRGSRLPALVLLPYYLVPAAWALKKRRPRYLLYSALFPFLLYRALKRDRQR